MANYWITFRLGDAGRAKDTYQDRYETFMGGLHTLIGDDRYWDAPTSYLAFQCDESLQQIAIILKAMIDTDTDMFLLCCVDPQAGYICGNVSDREILKILPHVKQL